MLAIAVILLAPPPAGGALDAAAAVRAAVADARRLDAETARHTRYHSAHHVPGPADRDELYAVDSLHTNGLSRKGFVVRPRKVAPWLWALDLRDYRLNPETYALTAFGDGPLAVDPYFHVLNAAKGGLKSLPAPWLPRAELAELSRLTASQVPVVRADWWLHRTFAQAGRKGFGYYDQLGLRSRADVDALAGLDRKKAVEVSAEWAAVVRRSGVAVLPRQVFRLNATTGPVWYTKDVLAETLGQGGRSATAQRLDNFKHQGEEGAFRLPNGLVAFWLSDDAGAFVDSAPDALATNTKAGNTDGRVHVGFSCWACHRSAGLVPFDDLNRRPGRLPETFPDREFFDRNRAVYYRELRTLFDEDVARYAAAIREACGLAPAAASDAIGRQWARYLDAPVTVAVAAAEVGLPAAEFAARVRAAVRANPLSHPLLAELAQPDPDPLRREEWEEVFPLVMAAIGNPGAAP